MNYTHVFLLISVLYLSVCGLASAGREYPEDILTNPKDDCDNVCGLTNAGNKNKKKEICGDPDMRDKKYLLVHDEKERKPEETEYDAIRNYECVASCPANYEEYKDKKICVKDPVQFEKDLVPSKTDDKINEKLDYTWWIVGGVGGLIIVALIVAFVFIKNRSG